MLINRDNFEHIFPSDRRIDIPRAEVFFTFLLHNSLMFIGHLLFYNVLIMIAMWFFIVWIVNSFTILRRIWKRVGYSEIMYWILWVVNFVVSAVAAYYIRGYILSLL